MSMSILNGGYCTECRSRMTQFRQKRAEHEIHEETPLFRDVCRMLSRFHGHFRQLLTQLFDLFGAYSDTEISPLVARPKNALLLLRHCIRERHGMAAPRFFIWLTVSHPLVRGCEDRAGSIHSGLLLPCPLLLV